MTGRYQTYPEYKESGVDWFGKIPSHWKVAGFKKHLDSIVDYRGKTPVKTDDGVLLVTARNIKNGELDYSLSQEFISPDDFDDVMSRGKAEKGHVLFTTEAPLGEVANIDRTNIALAQRIIKFDGLKNELNNFYFKYLIMSEEFQQSLNLFASGSTVKGIKAERFVYLRNLLPSFEEQQKIANFLVHETAKIDTLVAKQEKLIELLKEKRQAVISHAVTRGLNPNAQMKDSGVEWLGEVPEHWDVKKLKFCANLLSQKETITTQTVIALENIEGGTGKYITSNSKYSGDGVLFNEGDILFGKLRPYLSKVFLCDTSGIAFGDILAFRPNNETSSSFLFYTMISEWFIEIVNSSTYGSKMPRASSDFINEMEISIPPIDEQIRITEELDTVLGKFDILTQKSIAAIELMKERKTALISAAVTGKIDVRNYNTEKAEG